MATADELLAAVVRHAHPVIDSDSHYMVDPSTRIIESTVMDKNKLIQYDHDSERLTFEVPRYVDGHDMVLCNATKIHYINIEVIEETEGSGGTGLKPIVPKSNIGTYDVTDIHVSPDDRDVVVCSWLVSRNATQLAGTLNFLIQYACVNEDGDIVYEWHTDIYTDVIVSKGMNNGEAIVLDYADVLEQWRDALFGSTDSEIQKILNASSEQQNAIAIKGADTLATIPADYTEVYNMAEEAFRTKADAIVCEAKGYNIHVTDSSDIYLYNLRVFGKSSHSTTTQPSPTYPQDLVHIVNPIITIDGYDAYVEQTFTVDAANGLPGLSVSSNGTYIDSNGQYWIADEKNYREGIYVQRVKELDLSTFENWRMWDADTRVEGILGFYHYVSDKLVSNEVACNILPCNTLNSWEGKGIGCMADTSTTNRCIAVSISVEDLSDVSTDSAAISSLMSLLHTTSAKMLVAIEPVESGLSLEEVNEFKRLQTNYPNTTIHSDSNIYMEVQYIADTEIFMQNQPKTMTDEQVSTALELYLSENPIEMPTDEHINELIYTALGVIENGSY